jgi:hypothetical protein
VHNFSAGKMKSQAARTLKGDALPVGKAAVLHRTPDDGSQA